MTLMHYGRRRHAMGVEVLGLSRILDRFRSMPKRVQSGLTEYIVDDELRPMVPDMRGAASGVRRQAAVAAQHITVGIEASAGKLAARGPSNHTLMGAEYGGRKRGKKAYAT